MTAATEACPDPETLSAMALGTLSTSSRDLVVSHMAGCVPCRELVSVLSSSRPAARPSSDAALRAGDKVGRYELGERIGVGAMGEVWTARDPDLERTVAIKVLRDRAPSLAGTEGSARLRAEAQSMARVQHPNVVGIYELGTAEDRVFCAMELIAGQTLRDWRADRSWRDIVRASRDVGRGLAAVHRAGLVHRDVKPDNVLIAADGRAVVGDFGLARLIETYGAHGGVGDVPGADTRVDTMTMTGAVVGTPAFMAPEQLLRREATAASDQFSLCATLYESLFERRPFPATTLAELQVRLTTGADPAPHRTARGDRVPRRLRAALARGLNGEPAARFASIDELVDELDAILNHRPGRTLAIGLGIAAAATVSVVLATRDREDDREARVERDVEALALRAWSPERREALERTFVALGHPAAKDTVAAVARRLDALIAAWRVERVDAWRATHVRNEQSADTLEKRLSCLDAITSEVSVVVEALSAAPDRQVVEHAIDATARLGPVSRCSDPRNLDREREMAADPHVQGLRRDLARVRVALDTGQAKLALDKAREVDAAAAGSPAISIAARARALRMEAEQMSGELAAAEASAKQTIDLAARARDHELVARAWIALMQALVSLGRIDDAAALDLSARAAVAQAGDNPRGAGSLERVLALIAVRRNDRGAAAAHLERAVSLYRQLGSDGAPGRIDAETTLATLLGETGDVERGRTALHAALTSTIEWYGPRHPRVASVQTNLGELERTRGDLAAAATHHEAALELRRAVLGDLHPETGVSFKNLGTVRMLQRRFDEAAEMFEHARTGFAKFPPKHLVWLVLDYSVAELATARGDVDGAIAAYERAIEIARVAVPPGDGMRTGVLNNLAVLLCDRGAGRDALRYAIEAAENVRRNPSADPATVHEVDATRARAQALVDAAKRPRRRAR